MTLIHDTVLTGLVAGSLAGLADLIALWVMMMGVLFLTMPVAMLVEAWRLATSVNLYEAIASGKIEPNTKETLWDFFRRGLRVRGEEFTSRLRGWPIEDRVELSATVNGWWSEFHAMKDADMARIKAGWEAVKAAPGRVKVWAEAKADEAFWALMNALGSILELIDRLVNAIKVWWTDLFTKTEKAVVKVNEVKAEAKDHWWPRFVAWSLSVHRHQMTEALKPKTIKTRSVMKIDGTTTEVPLASREVVPSIGLPETVCVLLEKTAKDAVSTVERALEDLTRDELDQIIADEGILTSKGKEISERASDTQRRGAIKACRRRRDQASS